MGTFGDGEWQEPIDDVDLAHLEIVAARVLSSGLPLVVTVVDDDGERPRARAVSAATPLRFHYGRVVEPGEIDEDRLVIMLDSAGAPHGLMVPRSS